MFRKQILENAIRTVCQDRRDQYGQIEDNFGLIADLWSSYLGASVTAVDVTMMMGMLKMARIKTGKYTQDNFVDLAGYAACGAECTPEALQEKERLYCDEPMARSKGYIEDSDNPNLIPCNKNCESCICCIEVAEDGSREHVEIGRY